MSETRSHRCGRKVAENIIEAGNLMYNDRTKANFFRGIIRGLLKHEWIIQITKEWLKDLGELK